MAKVLIIDDDAEVAGLLEKALAGRGVESVILADGNEGLAQAKTYQPDAIVLCVELPRVSGYSICNKLKKDPTLAAIPLILTSTQATEETFEQHRKLKTRAEGYVKKPCGAEDLVRELAQHIAIPEGNGRRGNVEYRLQDVGHDEATRVGKPAAAPSQDRFDLGDLQLGSEAGPALQEVGNENTWSGGAGALEAQQSGEFDLEGLAIDEEPQLPPRDKGTPVTSDADGVAKTKSGEHRVSASTLPRGSALADLMFEAASETVSGSDTPAPRRATDTQGEAIRAENRQLRQKVTQLEKALADKDLEFNDRLLEESSRSRDTVELKKKIVQLEREVARHQQTAERAHEEQAKSESALQQLQERERVLAKEKQILSSKTDELSDNVRRAAALQQSLQAQLEQAEQSRQAAQQELETAQKVRAKARKAVDIALHLLDEASGTAPAP